MSHKRRIFAIRHGESEWNVLYKKHPTSEERYHPRMWTVDCNITNRGIEQARQAGTDLYKLTPCVDLLVISPMRRALQTAANLVKTYPTLPTNVVISKEAAEILMDPCDIGSTPDELKTEFPAWKFDYLPDYWWHGGKSPSETLKEMVEGQDGLETEKDAHQRIEALKELLRERKEEVIALVCHSDTIWWLTRRKMNGEYFGERAQNGEILDITDFVLSSGAERVVY